MAECSNTVSQQASEINMQNMKVSLDAFAEIARQAVIENQSNYRNQQAFLARVAEDAQVVKHLAQLNVVTAAQTGQTENEQTVSPASTAASETAKGAVADAGAQIATQVAALSDVVTKFSEVMAAMTALVGLQVQPKTPTAGA